MHLFTNWMLFKSEIIESDQKTGVAYAPVSKSEDFTVRVPTGVQASLPKKIVGIAPKLRISWQDLKILVTASFAMMITFNDPLEPKEIPFVQDAERTAIWRGLTLQLDAGKATASHRWHSKIVGRPNLKVKSLQTPLRSGKAGRRFASIIFVCQ